LIAAQLAPHVNAIDREGEYPEDFLRALGAHGGYAGVVAAAYGGNGKGLADTIGIMARVGETCLSTAFAVWCQTACARYIQLSDNAALKTELLPGLADGRQLGGTGLSNTLKSCGEIERFLLSARRVEGGYEVSGTLPWVSNLGADHVFVTGCPVKDDDGLVFFVVRCNQPGFKLQEGAHFTALEGTRTFACQFRGVRIDDARVLAHPDQSRDYLARIQPGMILAQMGMGLGLVEDCIRLIDSAGRTHRHINQYVDDQADELRAALATARTDTLRFAALADTVPLGVAQATLLTKILRLRLVGGELSLRAAQAAMLHQGARGYLRHATAQRRLREAYFVAIVTPSLKHLRYELARRGTRPTVVSDDRRRSGLNTHV
jgi:alkylation response protein AidB-like acyl-CoA dehydrogenase